MSESSALIADLRRLAATGEGVPRDDRPAGAWLDEGLAPAQLHEVFAQAEDGASAAGFAIALALAARATPLLWLRAEASERRAGRLHATGLVALGLDPAALLLAVVPDTAGALLRAAADAARCAGLGTLLIETWGPAREIDLTASRRLMLAAEASGVTVLLLRVAATPVPSAAATRWQVAAAASRTLDAAAPGPSAYTVECLRRRGGPAGAHWRVEWNRDTQGFVPAPLSGARLPLVADRAVARGSPAPVRRSG